MKIGKRQLHAYVPLADRTHRPASEPEQTAWKNSSKRGTSRSGRHASAAEQRPPAGRLAHEHYPDKAPGRLVEKYPEAPLFRSPRSKRGITRNGVRCRFRNLRAKLSHLAGVINYTMRHSIATQALVNGVGIAHVAELMGHVETSMVSQHYAHLAGNVQHMREAARKAAGG